MSQARAPRHRRPRQLPAAQGWTALPHRPTTGRSSPHPRRTSQLGLDSREVLGQPPERDELAPRYPKVAARDVLDEPSRHLHALHCHAAHRRWLLTKREVSAWASGAGLVCDLLADGRSRRGHPRSSRTSHRGRRPELTRLVPLRTSEIGRPMGTAGPEFVLARLGVPPSLADVWTALKLAAVDGAGKKEKPAAKLKAPPGRPARRARSQRACGTAGFCPVAAMPPTGR